MVMDAGHSCNVYLSFFPSFIFCLFTYLSLYLLAYRAQTMTERSSLINKPDKDSSTDEEAILELQSSDVDSSSDDDANGNKLTPYPSKAKISTWKATISIASYTLGVGMLAMPYAVAQGGITAILLLFIIPFIYWYANKVIVECLYDQDKGRRARVRTNWKGIGEVLAPKYGGCIVIFLQNFILFIVSTSYLILCGSLMVHILPSLPINQALWTCIAAILVSPTALFKSYSQIAWLNLFGIVTLFATAVATVWQSLEHVDQWDLTSILFWDNQGVLMSLGILLYSYAFFELTPSIEDSMENRAQFGHAMAWALLIAASVNVPFSLCAFLWFGFNTDGIVVNNLPPGPVHISIVIGFLISFLFSYSLPLQPAFLLLEDSETFANLSTKFSHSLCYVVLRISVVCFTLILAVLIPHFALMSFFDGSFISPFLAFIIPCMVYFKLRRNQLNACQITALSFLFVFGVIVVFFSIFLVLFKAVASF